jgi:hypothetical protein
MRIWGEAPPDDAGKEYWKTIHQQFGFPIELVKYLQGTD